MIFGVVLASGRVAPSCTTGKRGEIGKKSVRQCCGHLKTKAQKKRGKSSSENVYAREHTRIRIQLCEHVYAREHTRIRIQLRRTDYFELNEVRALTKALVPELKHVIGLTGYVYSCVALTTLEEKDQNRVCIDYVESSLGAEGIVS